jgi:two-component system OmpR family response regulator
MLQCLQHFGDMLRLGWRRQRSGKISPETSPARILVVDDDDSLRDAIAGFLSDAGFRLRVAANAAACDRALAEGPADLIVLDVMMPGEDGLSLCRRLAPVGTPILMLSALEDVTDRVVGLEIGAWDYVVKPCEPRELLARVRALLRRPAAGAVIAGSGGNVFHFDGWRFDVDRRHLTDPCDRRVSLSEGEYNLLAAFAMSGGRVLSRDTLLDLTRGVDAQPYDRAIDVAVSRLRRRLSEFDPSPLITTVRGVGYRFLPVVRLS